MATKAQLAEALEAAQARITELEAASGGSAPAAGDVFIRYAGTGPVPGGLVSPGMTQRNPSPEAMATIAHVLIDREEFVADPGAQFDPGVVREGSGLRVLEDVAEVD